MKNIILLFLLIFSLYADENRTAPSNCILENAKDITIQGWDVASESVKQHYTEDDMDISIKEFLKIAENPLEINLQKESTEQFYDIPKLNLKASDYYYALAYTKYLETQNRLEESLKIYRTMLIGLKESSTISSEMVALIYRTTIENIIVKSLQNSILNNLYTSKQKNNLYHFLKNNLLLNRELFFTSLENDRHIMYKLCERKLVIDNNTTIFIYHESLKSIIKDSDLAKTMFKEICNRLDEKRKKTDSKLYQISNEEENRDFEKTININEAKLHQELAELKNKSPDEIKALRNNPNNYINFISDILYYKSVPKVGVLKLHMLDNIELNKQLLEYFEEE